LVGGALTPLAPRSVPRAGLAATMATLAILPDLDVVAFSLGIPYVHWLGHRGVSHSLPFALALAAVVALGARRRWHVPVRDAWILFGLYTVATASHGVLDALTDGGLGVAFFAPFDDARHFLPLRPIHVSPIGIRSFFEGPALAVLESEIVVVWLPVLAVLAALRLGRVASGRATRERARR
ncbi:MAG TPA: metal-dependent hydrolase, partial [Alphaproteobacteria bacterium]|nr:metal-dependent hydrolase [Alphaproteobacteria bacterium]